MSRYVVRDATLDDAPLLAAAERAVAAIPGRLVSLPHELKDAHFAARIAALARDPHGRYLVAEHDGVIVGHAQLDPMGLHRTRHVVRLTLVVHPGREGRGAGRALLEALVAWARATPGIDKVELLARATNEPALALYRKLGFEEEGRFRGRVKLDDGSAIDDVAMALFVR